MTRARRRVISELLSIVFFFLIMIGAAMLAENVEKTVSQHPEVVISSAASKSF